MQISINVGNITEKPIARTNLIQKLRTIICRTSLRGFLIILITFFGLLFVLYICKLYTSLTLLWLEKQDVLIIYLVIIVLFTLVSFPISIGYIIIVIACGYLFGVLAGLILSVIGANIGLIVAHNAMKVLGHHRYVRSYLTSNTAQTILKVISGPSSFKIIFCARLTPIPFGLQNSIFAFSKVNGQVYHIASILGLFPGQLVGIYVGSSLRSMQDVLDDQQISTFTYVFAAGQLIFSTGLLVWLGSRARKELTEAIAEADGKYTTTGDQMGNISSYSIV